VDLDDRYRTGWQEALAHAEAIGAQLRPVDVTPFLDAGALLYKGPWIAERWAAFGAQLDLDGVDPTVRRVVSAGREVSGSAVFEGLDRLARLRRATEAVWADIDALLLPTTPCHPTPEEVARDPIGVNARLGTFTNFVNLLDLCAVAVPAGTGPAFGIPKAGIPTFGVQLIAPAFADLALWDLASRWCGEGPIVADAPRGRSGSWL
jgi:allophanate hydrolase